MQSPLFLATMSSGSSTNDDCVPDWPESMEWGTNWQTRFPYIYDIDDERIFSCFVPKSPTTKICCHPMFGAPGSHESVDLGDTVMCTNLAMVMRGKEEQLGSSDIMMGISETTITWISSDDKQFTYPYVVVCLLYWPVIWVEQTKGATDKLRSRYSKKR